MELDELVKPRRLKPGMRLGFVGPSGAVPRGELVERSVRQAEALGFKVDLSPCAAGRYGYLAGRDEDRARELNDMFLREDIDAVVPLRGGYGTPRILNRLDYAAARRDPKLFLGFSDITGLHLAYGKLSRLVTLHSPMPTGDWATDKGLDELTRKSFWDMATGEAGPEIMNPPDMPLVPLSGGVCEGALVGGNLSLICALMGTPYGMDFAGKILLIEEVGEWLYRVDRLLAQLRLSGAFDVCAGIVLGQFTRCDAEYPERSLTLEQIFSDLLPKDKPVLSNFAIGHGPVKITVPLNIRYRLDADNGSLEMLESPFRDL